MDPITIALMGGGLLSSFIGGNKQAKAAKQAAAQQAAAAAAAGARLDSAATSAGANLDDYYSRAMGTLAPLSDPRALDLYNTAIGVNGAGPQSDWMSKFMADPTFVKTLMASLNPATSAMAKYGNAGWVPKVMQDRAYDFVGNAVSTRLGQLWNSASVGTGATQKMADYTLNQGRDKAQLDQWRGSNGANATLGIGAANAAGTVNAANAWSSAITGGVNNIAGLYGNYMGWNRPVAARAPTWGTSGAAAP